MTDVRNYKDIELINKIKNLESFEGFPSGDFLVGVRSNERTFNKYGDKFYHFNKNLRCVNVLTGTTISGSYGVKNFLKWNKEGYAEIKDNECYYNVWKGGLHRGKMKALKQVGKFKVIRKKTFNDPTTLWKWESWKGLNFHTNSYNVLTKIVKWVVNGWSTGCQVANDPQDYYNNSIEILFKQKSVSYFLLKEF